MGGNSKRGPKSGMKAKLAIVTLVLSTAIIASLVVAFWRFGHGAQDSRQRKFVENAGFLTSHDDAIDNYAKAISILQRFGIDAQFLEKHYIDEQCPMFSSNASDEFVKLIIKGAKANRLGIKVKRPEALTTQIYTLDNKRFEFENFKLLSKAIAHVAEVELTQRADIDKAVLLGSANLALGVQLSAYNVDFIHMCGIACKTLGLQTLEECARTQNDKNLTALVAEMSKERDKEFEIVKNMPPTLPSFWDFFKQCMKTKRSVNETD